MKIQSYNVPPIFYFIVVALLIAYFFPREGKFRYQFHEGKPWRYGLLTAPNDFPIYKTDSEVKTVRDSLLAQFEPYYRLDNSTKREKIELLRSHYNTVLRAKASPAYMQYIEAGLIRLYDSGIIDDSQSLDKLREDGVTRIRLLENNTSTSRYVSDLFTIKTAYEYLINNCPRNLDKAILQSCDINNYLDDNVTYDPKTSDKVKADMLQNVSISSGLVQAGERIVDRGQIIDNHTYNVLRSLKMVHEAKSGGAEWQSLVLGGQLMLVLSFMLSLWLYLKSFRPKIIRDRRSTLFLLICVLTFSILTELCVSFSLFSIYILPYAIVPIVVRTFFDSRTALFTHLITILICSLVAPFPHEFMLLQMLSGMVVIFSLKELSQRSELIRCAFFIFIAYVAAYICLTIYQEGDFGKINWVMVLYFGINFILLMFTYVLVYILEKAFSFVSSITLVELSNINTPILKQLSETCPGTFQHSLQVSILASEAAAKIGANAQLVRTGAMYHDIGKMSNPVFFTENQNSINPHDKLAFDESAQIIISHVTEGVKIAEKMGLPKAVVNFIRTHHGRGKAKYFYNCFCNQNPGAAVNEELFTYPGPNPFTKETAVMMMADSVEAASRSLKEHTEEGIRQLVDKIVNSQIADGLLQNTPLTYRDVETVKGVFVDKLKTMFHTRISYPDLKKANQ